MKCRSYKAVAYGKNTGTSLYSDRFQVQVGFGLNFKSTSRVRIGSSNLVYGPGSGFSLTPMQTATLSFAGNSIDLMPCFCFDMRFHLLDLIYRYVPFQMPKCQMNGLQVKCKNISKKILNGMHLSQIFSIKRSKYLGNCDISVFFFKKNASCDSVTTKQKKQ